MAKRKNANNESGLLEDPNAIIDKTNEFFENKKKRTIVLGVLGVVVAVIMAVVGYNYYITDQNHTAQEELFQAQLYFEIDSLNLALNGDGNNYGFLDIIDEYSGTKAANLANFYSGVCYLKLRDFDGAIRYLKDFNSSDYLVQARAYSLIADAYMELADFSEAINYYEQASSYNPNKSITPIYFKKLAIAQEQQGNLNDAIDTYSKIISKYPLTTYVHDAKKSKARLQGLLQ